MSCKCVRCGVETSTIRLGGLCNPCHYEDPDLDPIEEWVPPSDLPVPAWPEEDCCADCGEDCPTDNQCHFCGESLCDGCVSAGPVPVCASCEEEE
jgi:hypothetical protein